MSLNIIQTTNITEVSELLLESIKKEEAKALRDMKSFLAKTNLSTEEKVKEYSSFSSNIFGLKLNAVLDKAQQYVVTDEQLKLQDALNKEQINLTKKEVEVQEQNRLNAVEQNKLIIAQKNQVEKETDFTNTKIWLAIAETKTKLDLTVAQTLSEARRNGAAITSIARSFIDPTTGTSISYDHISLAAVEASNMTDGEIGKRMALWEKQSKSFDKHAKVQTLGQYINLAGIGLDNGAANMGGLFTTIKTIADDVTEIPTSDISTISAE